MSDGESETPAKKKNIQYGSLEGKVGESGAESIQKGVEAGNINISDPSKFIHSYSAFVVNILIHRAAPPKQSSTGIN